MIYTAEPNGTPNYAGNWVLIVYNERTVSLVIVKIKLLSNDNDNIK